MHDYGEDDGPAGGGRTAYLVMELVRGEPLSTRIARGPDRRRRDAATSLEEAAWALQAAHERGFVHRDVKPGNILLRTDGIVKLTDFGIAKAADAVPVTRSGMVMGTAHYIAPEQASGDEAGPAGDVYSLGIVGYECLAGHRPFRADSAVAVAMMQVRDDPPPLPSTIPERVRGLIESVLVKDPEQRYADGARVRRGGRRRPTRQPGSRRGRRNRRPDRPDARRHPAPAAARPAADSAARCGPGPAFRGARPGRPGAAGARPRVPPRPAPVRAARPAARAAAGAAGRSRRRVPGPVRGAHVDAPGRLGSVAEREPPRRRPTAATAPRRTAAHDRAAGHRRPGRAAARRVPHGAPVRPAGDHAPPLRPEQGVPRRAVRAADARRRRDRGAHPARGSR